MDDSNFFSEEELIAALYNEGTVMGSRYVRTCRRNERTPLKRPDITARRVVLPFEEVGPPTPLTEITNSNSPEKISIKQEFNNEDIDIQAYEDSRILTRKRCADNTLWTRELNKAKRMRGEAYIGYNKLHASSENISPSSKIKFQYGAQRQEKAMGQRCKGLYCSKRKNYFCSEFSDDVRGEIFENFWKNMDWKQKKAYVKSLIDCVPVKRRIMDSSERRKETFIYYLKLNEKKVQVCREMFLSTLGVKKNQIIGWLRSTFSAIASPPTKNKTREKRLEIRDSALVYLDLLPKLPSHYCRSSTSKLYLEPTFKSKNELFESYKTFCLEKQLYACSRFTFSQIVKERNIGIFSPRKDQCDICVGFKNKEILEQDWILHRNKKDAARNEKESDKKVALDGACHMLTMDLQAVKLSPMLNASSLYYKTKLMVHNFTVYNSRTKDATCYWWDETEGDVGASVFATCLRDYILTNLNDKLPIVIFSDGCTSQNRNAMMANALLDIAIRQNRIITQKYLEKGHTQMECDSVHSAIESKLKNKSIYVPSDYAKLTTEARAKQPYKIKLLSHEFFKDFTMKKTQRYSTIRPGEKKGDPCVTDIRGLQYKPSGVIAYKLKFENNWTTLPHAPKDVVADELPNLFQSRIKISARKYRDLQEIKSVIPSEFHEFYNNLPHI